MKFALLVLAMISTNVFAASETGTKKPMDPMMEAMMKAATPGEEHKTLAMLAGTWKYTSKWWKDAAAKPEESTGMSTNKMVMGGRYMQSEAKGKAMGMPFMGMGMTGFDNVTKKMETMWIDNMGTGMAKGTGTWDPSTKTMMETGSFSDPTAPNMTRNYRATMKIMDNKSYMYEMYTTGMDGKEYKMMEMMYKKN